MFKSLKHALKNRLRRQLLPLALRALEKEIAMLPDLDTAVDLAFRFRHQGIRFTPSQVRAEITNFLQLLAQRPPATVLEIGTEKGGTFFLLCRAARPDALLLSLDLPAGEQHAYPAWREPLYRAFQRERQRIDLVRKDSHDPRTQDFIRERLAGRPLDLLFIDGDHRYEGVKQDFEMYSPLVSPTGLIVFHDIVDGTEASVGGVPRFWRELKQQRRHLEFVQDWKQGGWGLGVLLPAASFKNT